MDTATFRPRESFSSRHHIDDLVERLTAAGVHFAQPATYIRTILDTFDGRVHGSGMRLESRREALSDDPTVQLILAAQSSVPAGIRAATCPVFIGDVEAGPFRHRLERVVEMRALLPQLTFEDRIREGSLRDGSAHHLAAIVIHEVSGPPHLDVPYVVEVIELPGHRKHARRLRDELDAAGFVPSGGDVVSQLFASAGVDPGGFCSTPTVPLDADMTAVAGFGAVLVNLCTAIRGNWDGTIDDIDTEFLHELRVAVRRTRTVLGVAKDVVPNARRESFRTEFAWLAQLTGPTRDLDVYLLGWDDYVAPLGPDVANDLRPVYRLLQRRRAAELTILRVGLTSPRGLSVISAWQRFLESMESGKGGAEADHPLGSVVEARIRRAHLALLDDGRRIDDTSPDEQLHELRKDAKRLRYLIECFGGLLPARKRKAFVSRLKTLQDNLGEHQDAAVHVAELRAISAELSAGGADPATLHALAHLSHSLQRRQDDMREEFSECFAEYDTDSTHKTMAALLAGIGPR